jgi:hypothetical protein
MPVHWCADGDPGVEGAGTAEDVVSAAFAAWESVAPCAVSDVNMGECEPGNRDVQIAFHFGDPNDELEDGVLLVEYMIDDFPSVVFNNNVAWRSDAVLEAEGCEGDGLSIEAEATHVLAEYFALDETYLSGWPESCRTTYIPHGAAGAVSRAYDAMFVSTSFPGRSLEVGEETCFYVVTANVPEEEAIAAEWDWGDGATESAERACHSYNAEGEYAASVSWTYPEECGGVTVDYSATMNVSTASAGDSAEPDGSETGGCSCANEPTPPPAVALA